MSAAMESWFAIFGMVVVGTAVVAAACFAALVVCVYVASHFPRFHVGRPHSKGELKFFDYREISTRKNGEVLSAPGTGRLIQQLGLTWWIGMSSRDDARWFFGLMRWKRERGE
jgi:hypothetical protein